MYNNIIGYSDIEIVDSNKINDIANIVYRILEENNFHTLNFENLLIAGCGNGAEAFVFREVFNIPTIGVDISLKENFIDDEKGVQLIKSDLVNMQLQTEHFSFIYSYHVLEHIVEYKSVLKTLSEKLAESGVLFIGFPNKNRLLGYIGTNDDSSIIQKIKWNLNDYKMKIRGRFKNELGAHAGFTEREFKVDSKPYFHKIISVRNEYMLLKYSKYKLIIKLLIQFKLGEILFPSNYFICFK